MQLYHKLLAQRATNITLGVLSGIIFTTLRKMQPTHCWRAIQVMEYTAVQACHIYIYDLEQLDRHFSNQSHQIMSIWRIEGAQLLVIRASIALWSFSSKEDCRWPKLRLPYSSDGSHSSTPFSRSRIPNREAQYANGLCTWPANGRIKEHRISFSKLSKHQRLVDRTQQVALFLVRNAWTPMRVRWSFMTLALTVFAQSTSVTDGRTPFSYQ